MLEKLISDLPSHCNQTDNWGVKKGHTHRLEKRCWNKKKIKGQIWARMIISINWKPQTQEKSVHIYKLFPMGRYWILMENTRSKAGEQRKILYI